MNKTPLEWAKQKGHHRSDAELAPVPVTVHGVKALVPTKVKPKAHEHMVSQLPDDQGHPRASALMIHAGWVHGQAVTEEEYDAALVDLLATPRPRAERRVLAKARPSAELMAQIGARDAAAEAAEAQAEKGAA